MSGPPIRPELPAEPLISAGSAPAGLTPDGSASAASTSAASTSAASTSAASAPAQPATPTELAAPIELATPTGLAIPTGLIAPTWDEARAHVYAAGRAAALEPLEVSLATADGQVLASPLWTLTDLPPFDTSNVDGYAVAGHGPWRLTGQVLAGALPAPLADGTAVEIATGAMVPPSCDHVLRFENTELAAGLVHGLPPERPEWRPAGEECQAGEELLPAGTAVTPGVIGLAASCGHDTLLVAGRPRVALLVFGDELLVSGVPGAGRVRDSLGPSLPSWLTRLGAQLVSDPPAGDQSVRDRFAGVQPEVPVEDTLDAHLRALESASAVADLIVTTGGTMHGPVDHLHPALAALGAEYVIDTVRVRPGFPMLVARLPSGTWIVGLPGNPQSATVALVSLVAPLLAGLRGRPFPRLSRVRLAEAFTGRGDFTHLALAGIGEDGLARPLAHAGSAMLRGVAGARGFVVVRPGELAEPGSEVDLAELPLLAGEP